MGGVKADQEDHLALLQWAASCAEHVLPYFENACPGDDRPRRAVEAGRAWARGELAMTAARTAAFAAHAAARDAPDAAARAAARAAGHAAATAHVATHARHAATYAVSAATHAAKATGAVGARGATAEERDWQHQQLPERLWPMAFPPPGLS